MKIEITVIPQFHLPLEARHIELLKKLAAMHYDWTCKRAGEVGGFIYGWNNHVVLLEGEELTPVTASRGELDTCLKILEFPPDLEQAEKDTLWEMRMAFNRALSHAGAFVRDIRTSA